MVSHGNSRFVRQSHSVWVLIRAMCDMSSTTIYQRAWKVQHCHFIIETYDAYIHKDSTRKLVVLEGMATYVDSFRELHLTDIH